MESGEGLLPIRVIQNEFRETYYQEIPRDSNAGGLVTEDFQLEVALEPALNGAELARLSAAERRNLEPGYSDLPSILAVGFPVRFEYPSGAGARNGSTRGQ